MKYAIAETKTLDEIIDSASELPLEYQDWILELAKAMAYTKRCMLNQAYKRRKEAQDATA